MPFTISLENNIVIVTLEGDYNPLELMDLFRRIRDENPTKLDFLYDVRNWNHTITNDEIRAIIKAFPPRFENPRVAVVAGKPIQYGLGRVVSSYAEFEGYQVIVTYEYDSALEFLRQ